MLQIIGIEQVIINRLREEKLNCILIKSKSSTSIYIQTNRGLRIRISDHLGHKDNRIIELFFISTLDDLITIIKNKDALSKYKKHVKQERKKLMG